MPITYARKFASVEAAKRAFNRWYGLRYQAARVGLVVYVYPKGYQKPPKGYSRVK